MTVVRAKLAAGRVVDVDSFTDLTDAAVAFAWTEDGQAEVTLTPDVADDVAQAVRIRIISQSDADEALRRQIADLLVQEPSADRTAALVELLAQLAVGWA